LVSRLYEKLARQDPNVIRITQTAVRIVRHNAELLQLRMFLVVTSRVFEDCSSSQSSVQRFTIECNCRRFGRIAICGNHCRPRTP
jgi:hypothetical protein